METPEITCCTTNCDVPLDANYWDTQWQNKDTGWDLGEPAPALKKYFDSISDKHCSILIPGCGNAHEANYLVANGFTNITLIDIAETAANILQEKFKNIAAVKIICGDFFAHQGSYDIIIEQTFFCALPPYFRQKYVWKMHSLLKENGILAGLLFNRTFEKSPPFGGSLAEYESLFKAAFIFKNMATSHDSVAPRAESELFIELIKNEIEVQFYIFEGITCNGCRDTITTKIKTLSNVLNANISSDFSNLLVVSNGKIELATMQAAVAYDAKYKIAPYTK